MEGQGDGEGTPFLRTSQTPSEQSSSQKRQSENDSEGSRRVRQPVQYYSINTDTSLLSDDSTSAIISRYKYYSRLHNDSSFQMPDHVVPSGFYTIVPVQMRGQQSSLITIFSLWNTMMGTSILSMPWAIKQAGFITGIILLLLMALLMLYTSYRILMAMQSLGPGSQAMDFSDVCGQYLGRWAQILAVGSSLLTLLGGGIVYWILMSNFMYNVVTFIYHHTTSSNTNPAVTPFKDDLRCPDAVSSGNNKSHGNISFGVYFLSSSSDHTHDATFDTVWDEYHTVPLFLVLVLGPLINFKSPTFFTKFNALGTISVCYLVSFVAYNTSKWGINLPFGNPYSNLAEHVYIPDFRGTFVALTGIAALAYFVQNCVISICRNQRHPENNVRDLIIAYILVATTYIYMGTMFYAAFPLNKDCIADNLLNNIADTNVLAFVARIGLFFQMMCVFPLLLYIFRIQLLHSLFGSVWPSLKHVLVLNFFLVAICVLFAVFLPHIGTIIGGRRES